MCRILGSMGSWWWITLALWLGDNQSLVYLWPCREVLNSLSSWWLEMRCQASQFRTQASDYILLALFYFPSFWKWDHTVRDSRFAWFFLFLTKIEQNSIQIQMHSGRLGPGGSWKLSLSFSKGQLLHIKGEHLALLKNIVQKLSAFHVFRLMYSMLLHDTICHRK